MDEIAQLLRQYDVGFGIDADGDIYIFCEDYPWLNPLQTPVQDYK